MNKREFIRLLGGAAAWPLVARAQEPGRIYRLGCLLASPRDASHHLALFDELQRLGFIDGQNLVVDAAGFGMSAERFAVHAPKLVKARVDVILAGGDAAVRAAQQATNCTGSAPVRKTMGIVAVAALAARTGAMAGAQPQDRQGTRRQNLR